MSAVSPDDVAIAVREAQWRFSLRKKSSTVVRASVLSIAHDVFILSRERRSVETLFRWMFGLKMPPLLPGINAVCGLVFLARISRVRAVPRVRVVVSVLGTQLRLSMCPESSPVVCFW